MINKICAQRTTLLLLSIVMVSIGCKQTTKQVSVPMNEDALEAREDSIKLANAYAAQRKVTLEVTPVLETEVVEAKIEDDAADDPAIWIHPSDAQKSLFFGSNKKGGIATYDIKGREIAYSKVGKINNIDVLGDFLGGTNRTSQALDIYQIDTVGILKLLTSMPMDSSIVDDIYGFCFAQYQGVDYAIINAKNGAMQQYAMKYDREGKLTLTLARTMNFAGQVEGMVSDAAYNALYVGQEDRGIWKLAIDPTSEDKLLLEQSTKANNPMIAYDIEGLTLLKTGKSGYIVASSQGNFSYALFDREYPHEYVTSFKVADADVDGTQETDGLDINTTPIGDVYPAGIMVIQDGFNFDGKQAKPQNFKYVSVQDLLDKI